VKGEPSQNQKLDGLKKLISERLKVEAEGPHPDPELLAALAENSLGERERFDLLGHLAACGECRDILYLAQPELVDRQLVFVPRKPSRWAMRWATLAASGIIAAGVLVSHRGILTERARVDAPEAAGPTAQQKPGANGGIAVTGEQTQARVRPQEKHMSARPQASLKFDESGEVHVASPPVSAARNESASGTASMPGPAKTRPAVWRLSPDGRVQDSADSGTHWQEVPVENGIRFHSITSLGDEIWVGGDGGALYHSRDSGRSWARVMPAASGKTLDSEITGIRFSDLENGTVTTANGQVWSTSDDGKNWRLK